jgi:hypothetical protein
MAWTPSKSYAMIPDGANGPEKGRPMAGTLFFVHGTGVRRQGYERTWEAVQEGARRNRVPAADFVGVSWGAECGVPLDRIADTLPVVVATREALGVGPPPTEEELTAAQWALLLDDPLFELRLAAGASQGGATTITVGEARADQEAVDRLGALAQSPPDLTGTGITAEEVTRAAETVAASAELREAALAAPSATDPDLVEAIARAVVATVLAGHRLDPVGTEPPAAVSGALRDALVDRVARTLVPVETRGGPVDWFKKRFVEFASKKVTAVAVDRRGGLMNSSLPGIGDILFYQRRGDRIRELVVEQLAGRQRPVVAVGHSLGGIVLMDLLTAGQAPPVDLLVTAGSQSPLFFAIDALGSVRLGEDVPPPFTPWLNIYNRQDLLSFCAERVFAGIDGIQDQEVDPKVPFPSSHSAYWHDDKVYQLIRDNWPRG